MTAKIGTYKGNPTLELREDGNDFFMISFGIRKAGIILEHITEIRAFVESNGTSIE